MQTKWAAETILSALFFLILATVVISVVLAGISKSERAECLKWQKAAPQYHNYYITHWQADQCAAHGIVIDAPIK